MTKTDGKIAAKRLLKYECTRIAKQRLIAASAAHIEPASGRELGPSNHKASVAQITTLTAIADNVAVAINCTTGRVFTAFQPACEG
jgi:hypothetical protein